MRAASDRTKPGGSASSKAGSVSRSAAAVVCGPSMARTASKIALLLPKCA